MAHTHKYAKHPKYFETQINVGDNKRGMHWPSLFSHLEVVWERKNSFCKSLAGFIKKEYTTHPLLSSDTDTEPDA